MCPGVDIHVLLFHNIPQYLNILNLLRVCSVKNPDRRIYLQFYQGRKIKWPVGSLLLFHSEQSTIKYKQLTTLTREDHVTPMSRTTSSMFCLDCEREEAPNPNVKQANSSYCSHHIYVRSQRSRERAGVKEVVELLRKGQQYAPPIGSIVVPGVNDPHTVRALGLLNRTDSFGMPKMNIDILLEFAEVLKTQAARIGAAVKAQGLELEQRAPYRKQIYEFLRTAWVLMQRRLPSQDEDSIIRRDADPYWQEDLARVDEMIAASREQVQ